MKFIVGTNKINIYYFFYILLLVCFALPTISISNSESYRWGINKEEAIKKHIPSGNYTTFTPSQKPEYENKILSFILAINSEIKDRIVIVRSESSPQRDFLFIRDKLYSVLENYGTISSSEFEKLIQKLSSEYKPPNIQKDKNTATYSFYGDDTKVLVLSVEMQKLVECKVYRYANKLFRMLITE